jgi:hypothetical protein
LADRLEKQNTPKSRRSCSLIHPTPSDVSDILDDVIALSVLGEGAVGLAGLVAEQAAHAREAGQVVRLHVAFHGAPVPVLEGTHAAEEDTT